MTYTISATFEKGVLVPKDPIQLREHQAVRLIVVERNETEQAMAHISKLIKTTEAWQANQPPDAVRIPEPFSLEERARLERDFEALLQSFRCNAEFYSEEEIAADVTAAVEEARAELASDYEPAAHRTV